MIGLLCFVLAVLASPFKSKLRLEAENAVLRHQLIVLKRRLHGRVRLTNNDRWFFIQLYRWFPSILKVVTIIRPETLVRWHRAGFRCYWRWKSRPQGGRPQIDTELRVLIRRMSVENPLWGAPRIHGQLLKLGLRSRSRASPSTWSNDGGRPARAGEPSCVTTRRTLPPWTCSLLQRSVSTCSMPSSSSGSTAETWSGSTSRHRLAQLTQFPDEGTKPSRVNLPSTEFLTSFLKDSVRQPRWRWVQSAANHSPRVETCYPGKCSQLGSERWRRHRILQRLCAHGAVGSFESPKK